MKSHDIPPGFQVYTPVDEEKFSSAAHDSKQELRQWVINDLMPILRDRGAMTISEIRRVTGVHPNRIANAAACSTKYVTVTHEKTYRGAGKILRGGCVIDIHPHLKGR